MKARPILRATLFTALLFAAMGGVTIWSLAAPADDPVGDAIAWADRQQNSIARWYAHGPVDAKPDWQAMQLQVPGGDAMRRNANLR